MSIVAERIEELELKLLALRRELDEVKALTEDTPPPRPVAAPPPVPSPPRPRPVREYVPVPPRAVRPPKVRLDASRLLSAVGLAWAGGIVTLLGIVFLFVLAVERGWIGPEIRVSFGGAASLVLIGIAWVLHRRFGHLHSALGAAGAGIAGAYATLLAATALYELVPSWLALCLAAAIAFAGVFLALRWSSQLVAGIGLLGATLVPAVEAFEGGLSVVGTAFAALVTGAALVVAISRGWSRLAALAAVAGGLQGAILVLAERTDDPGVVATAGAFAFVFAAGGVGWHLYRPRLTLGGLPTSLLLASGGFVLYSSLLLFDGWGQGVTLLVATAVYAAACAWLFRVRAYRDLSALLLGLALAVGAVGLAELLSGGSLTYVWAAEAVLLFWLAPRAGDVRFQAGGLAYLVLALVHALTNEARPEVLFTITSSPETALPSIVALSLACGACAACARPWLTGRRGERGLFRLFAPLLHALRENQADLRVGLGGTSGLFALYAAGVGIIAASAALGGSFQNAHAVVTGVWGVAGTGALLAGLHRGRRTLQVAALGWLALVGAKVLAFDVTHLDATPRSAALLAAGAAFFVSSVALARLGERNAFGVLSAAAGAIASLGFGLGGVCTLLDGTGRGLALIGVAVLYAVASGAFLRTHRDYATLLAAISAGVGAAAAAQLLSGSWLVAVYAAVAAGLAWIAVAAGERRLQVASIGYLLGALGVLLARAAPPTDFFTAGPHPAEGVPAVLAVVGALVAIAAACRLGRPEGSDAFDAALDRVRGKVRTAALWSAGTAAVYALSLAILELFEFLRPGTLESSFQSGHTAVSAAWGVLGLVLLYLGLRRSARSLQLGGFALFGVSLAKLFLYDLAQLSSITRAFSFLAVGAMLLVAGFFYQRLSSRRQAEPGPSSAA